MKTCIKNLFLLPALIAALGLILAGRVTAQTFTNLHNFTGFDGAEPHAGLILSGNTLYGTAQFGGSSGRGTVFTVNTNGAGFTNLYSFMATSTDSSGVETNSDGAFPNAGLILLGNTLYGTASSGGSPGSGTVFAVNTNGTGFTNLHTFTAASGAYPNLTNTDGVAPAAGLVLSGNTLYGTAQFGGSAGNGTVFAVNTNGTGFTNLHVFTALSGPFSTNSDGVGPQAGLILSGSTLYGTANGGGSSGYGTVFKLSTNGTGFTNMHSFNYNGGAYPQAGLILSGNTLYGTAAYGGSSDNGTVFAVNTNGTGFTNVHSFNYVSDGANPQAGLILLGSTLYGTAGYGGSSGQGTVFAVNTNGSGFTNLHNFVFGSDGSNPLAGLILSGHTLYGTAYNGGSYGEGTVFSLSLGSVSAPAPTLTIFPSGANVVLTWPTNATGFTLQSTTNLVSTAVWSNVSPAAVVVNTNNAVTNAISDKQKFYRLTQ
ncbi:MAG TPA: choice-of-anchor tandem repeat GloVer-containing protein [Candidatus Limnocylindrales bacterium]|nr:choice-of-anchor tandem repeat GloVer-containing protein [Candidatus Limnocylindrales bacterium]